MFGFLSVPDMIVVWSSVAIGSAVLRRVFDDDVCVLDCEVVLVIVILVTLGSPLICLR